MGELKMNNKFRVKHLNPRQGITTCSFHFFLLAPSPCGGVKHLNPRQGITTKYCAGARQSVARTSAV